MKKLILVVASVAIVTVVIWTVYRPRGVGTWNGRSIDENAAKLVGKPTKRFELHVARVESKDTAFIQLVNDARAALRKAQPDDAVLDRIEHMFDNAPKGIPAGWAQAIESRKSTAAGASPWLIRAYVDRTSTDTNYIIEAVADVGTSSSEQEAAMTWLFERDRPEPNGSDDLIKSISQGHAGFEPALLSLK